MEQSSSTSVREAANGKHPSKQMANILASQLANDLEEDKKVASDSYLEYTFRQKDGLPVLSKRFSDVSKIMSSWKLQSIRFGIVSLTSNVLLCLLYLLLTSLDLDPKLVITFSYAIHLSWTFILNKRWSFSLHGNLGQSLPRFLFLYGMLYFNNLIILKLLVDILQFSHLLVQAGVVVAYVPIIFLAQRYWVFHNNSAGSSE